MKQKAIFRFKTKEEFIMEFGLNWGAEVSWNEVGWMDYLHGTKIKSKFNSKALNAYLNNTKFELPIKDYDLLIRTAQDCWYINRNMIIRCDETEV